MGPLIEFYVARSVLSNHYHPPYYMIYIYHAYIYHILRLCDRLSKRLHWFSMSGFLFILFGFLHQSAYIFSVYLLTCISTSCSASGIFCCCPLLSLCKVFFIHLRFKVSVFVDLYNLDLWSILLYFPQVIKPGLS